VDEHLRKEFYEPMRAVPSRSVSEGLETDTSRMAKAQEEANRQNAGAVRSLDPEKVRKRYERSFQQSTAGLTKRKFKDAITGPEPTSTEHGLTINGKPVSSDEVIARSEGYKSLKDKVESLKREERARSMGHLGYVSR
jgi:hypothetical protein